MKKFLITGGVLFSILPAMALQLTDVIEPNDNGDCSGTDFQSNSVSMQAVYVTETCPAGYYFDVPANAEIDSTTGIVTGASCQPCTDGYYCPSTVTVATNNGVLSTQGRTQCPAGTYGNATNRGTIPSDTNDPDYNTILANYTACQACSGITYAANTGSTSCTSVTQGWYADKVNSNDPGNTTQTQCPFGYRAIAAASQGDCTKTVDNNYCTTHYPSSNFKHVATSGANAYTVVINSESIDENNQITFANRDFEPLCLVSFGCEQGHSKQSVYDWLVAHPDKVSSAATYCPPDGVGQTNNSNPSVLSCSTMEPGTVTWTLTGADKPMNELHFVSVCSNRAPDLTDPSSLVVDQATANFNASDTGGCCWLRNIDFPNQPWFAYNWYLTNGLPDAENCAKKCGLGLRNDGSAYMFGTMENGAFQDDTNSLRILNQLSVVNVNADVCVANTITINWGEDANQQDVTTTCTYGENFTAPQDDPNPTGHPGLKFLGWKVNTTNNNNNN